jgi:hypothetical protein
MMPRLRFGCVWWIPGAGRVSVIPGTTFPA